MLIDPDKEMERFISLREVLFLIAEARQCNPQKAAQWLALNMGNNGFKQYDPVNGLEYAEHNYSFCGEGTGLYALNNLARTGRYHLVETPVSQWSDDDIVY